MREFKTNVVSGVPYSRLDEQSLSLSKISPHSLGSDMLADTPMTAIATDVIGNISPNSGDNWTFQAADGTTDPNTALLGEIRAAQNIDGAPNFTTASTNWSGSTSVASTSNVSFVDATQPLPTANPVIATMRAASNPVSDVTTVVGTDATVELATPYSGTVSFAGPTGTLKIDNASSFSGTITGQLAIGDLIDFANISGGANVTIAYSGNNSPGTLTVSDGTHTANIALTGNYSLANFTASSDGQGGTIVVDPPVLPPGVTLQQIDGGSTYFASHGLTYAANAGWDSPSFIPIGLWLPPLTTQSDANRWHALDINTAFGITGDSSLALFRANGLSAVIQTDALSQILGNNGGSLGSESVGLLSYDEPSTYQQGVVAPLSTTANSVQDGRYWYLNNTGNFITYSSQGLNGAPAGGAAAVINTPVATPDGATRHIDVTSTDLYWFSINNYGSLLSDGAALLGVSSLTSDQAARGSNYGTQVAMERAILGDATPVYAFIEDGGPYTIDSTAASYITPPELNWAVWSSLINGARGIIYFNHTFAGPDQTSDNLADPFYQTVQPGQTVSIYTQVANTDALIAQMAPVLNSQTATGYVTVGPAPQLFSGIETMVKDYNGQFYIFADTRDSLTQTNIQATFTLADLNATSVTVVNENRTIAVVNGVFSDTFATAATVHIYQVNDAPAGPTISSVVESPASGAFSAGKVITLTLNLNEAVTVAGGTPTITLNDGGTATYTGGTGTNALTFSYTVAAGQNTPDLMATAVNLNSATIKDSAGIAANLSLTGLTQTGPYIGTTTPVITSLVDSPSSGAFNAGKVITLTLNLNEAVTVTGGTPTITLNDGGTATYTSGSGTSALTFSYTVLAGQNTPDLMATAVNLNSASVKDIAGNVANLSLASIAQGSPLIDTTAPTSPVISSDSVSSSNVVTLNGTAEANSTVTVLDGTTHLGTTTASATGTWTYATAALPAGSHSFTATDTDAAGNASTASAALNLTLTAPVNPVNLVTNGSFETGDLTGWTLGGNYAFSGTPEIYTTSPAQSGQYSAGFGSIGTDGTLSQTLQTVAGQQYTLSFWLQNEGASPNDFTAKWNGTAVMALASAPAQGWTQYTFTVTATGPTSVLEFDARQDPAQWDLDNISVTANGAPAPSAPTIASFTTDSGVVGDHITNDNTLTLTGSAAANSTVNVYDGATLLNSVVASASGTWTYTTAALADGTHSLTATDTVSGSTSAASTALSVTIDTTAPTGGTPNLATASDSGASATDNITDITSPTFTVALNPTVAVGDTVQLLLGGSALAHNVTHTITAADITAGSVSLAVTAGDLGADGSKSISAKFADTAGNTSTTSALAVTLDTLAPNAPIIATDVVVNTNEVSLTGTAEANSTVKLYDGATLLGSTTADGSGAWSYTTSPLADGSHVITGTATDKAGNISLASQPLDPTIGTAAPHAPTIVSFSPDTGVVGDGITDKAILTLTGTAEANSTVKVYDGATLLGSASANSGGAWNFTTTHLLDGSHSFSATDMDLAGDTSPASLALNVTVDTTAPMPAFTNLVHNSNGTVTLSGTSEAHSSLSIYDGTNTTPLGTLTTAADGTWSFTTSTLSNAVHNFTLKATDVAGNVGTGTNAALYGPTSHETLNVAGNDIVTVLGTSDTFVFGSNLGKDVISGFQATGWHHDVLQFSHNTFSSFADVLAHAAQVGSNVVITADATDMITLKNVQLSNLSNHDIHII